MDTGTTTGPTPAGYVIVCAIGVAFAAAAVVKARRTMRLDPADTARSKMLYGSAWSTAYAVVAAALVGILAPRMATVAAWFCLVPIGLAATGWVQQLREAHQTRVDRRALGLPAIRRRVHWGWAALLGCVLGTGISVGIMLLLIAAHAVSGTSLNRHDGTFTALGWLVIAPMLGLPVLFGCVQSVRRKRRDRHIREADLAAGDLALIDPYAPPAWVPTPAEGIWREVRASMDQPVEPAKARRVLLRCVVANLALIPIGVVAAFLPPDPDPGVVPVGVRVVVAVIIVGALAGFFASVTLRQTAAAWRCLRRGSRATRD